jgi:hypothetical protein
MPCCHIAGAAESGAHGCRVEAAAGTRAVFHPEAGRHRATPLKVNMDPQFYGRKVVTRGYFHRWAVRSTVVSRKHLVQQCLLVFSAIVNGVYQGDPAAAVDVEGGLAAVLAGLQ